MVSLATGKWPGCGPYRLCRRHEPDANRFGYSLLDLDRADPFPVGAGRTG